MKFTLALIGAVVTTGFVALAVTSFEHPPVVTSQNGYRGTGMEQIQNPATVAALQAANVAPPPQDPVDPGSQKSSEVYQNVHVLKNVGSDEFIRLMSAITEWVAPEAGCNACHNPDNLADDSLYTKVVARRMIEMTQHINSQWKAHVGATEVTCYTCHRGNQVPKHVWYADAGVPHAGGFAQAYDGQNHPNPVAGMSAMVANPMSSLLDANGNIRVVSTTALPGSDNASIKDAERTYSLMMHLSQSLGVNCTFCHNAQAFTNWSTSTPQRVTAWQGIQMVRDLNQNYLMPLASTLPPERLGLMGDGPKLNCMTCHQGVNKPLYGVNMAKDYPELQANP
jgi:photosynthetic reaction center cytochrome c subunit